MAPKAGAHPWTWPDVQDGQNTAENLFVQMGEYVLRFESEDFGKEYEERARLELRETPESTKEACEKLREILKADAELDVPYEEENFLVTFLRPTHFYPESAYERMQNFFKFKVKYPKYCANLIPSRERNVFEQGILTVFPNRDHLGRRVLLIEAGKKWKPKLCSLDEIFKGVMLVLEAAISEPRTQVCGVQVILDMDGLALTHVWQFTPGFAKAVVEWVQDCIPVRLKGVHIINQPYVFNMVFAIFKPLLNAKLRNRIHFHGTDRQSLLNHVDAKCLPKTYGGEVNIPEFPGGKLCDLLSNYDSHYEMRNQNGYSKKT
ncbi:alpha-tocopherol transfer protein isoform X2 [Frankliniella occidentalis]|uniref:Alpha-tocopherol transfer protein isoform X2 n=1 Tax=Frankliniella occidentalis TaxID=133901 RepID=A0A6J1SF21_FRAOC|nr:alpha-tocopherol transfer protein isoform X2 [Frankliniella occidentalis]XP_026277914.1 alpha-tocopherol transfer protein isoform X2 [Frankliniella occidentalis]